MIANVECMHCGNVYDVHTHAKCDACGKQGGYMQSPKHKQIGSLNVALGHILEHGPSKNQYKVKEIQANGVLCLLHFSFTHQGLVGKRMYISNNNLSEYEIKNV